MPRLRNRMDREYNFAYLLNKCTYESCRDRADLRFYTARLEAGKRALAGADPADGLADWLCFSYLHDVWVGESPDPHRSVDNSQDIALLVWEGADRPAGVSDRSWRKLENVKSAMIELGTSREAAHARSPASFCKRAVHERTLREI